MIRLIVCILMVFLSSAQVHAQLSGAPPVASTPFEVPDYTDWGAFAERVEEALQDPTTPTPDLAELRTRIAEWRAKFTQAQAQSNDRLATVRTQLTALGPAPEEGAEEAEEIAKRRQELQAQATALEAPTLAADEAFTRASGLIGEIDTITRDRQTQALMELLPTPLNPEFWPKAAERLTTSFTTLGQEVTQSYATSQSPSPLKTNLPTLIGLVIFAVLALTRTQSLVDIGISKINDGFRTRRGRNAFGIFLSTSRVIFPTAGLIALCSAARLTGLVGPSGLILLDVLPYAGAAVFCGIWLGATTFPAPTGIFNPLGLDPQVRKRGRILMSLLGLVTGLNIIHQTWIVPTIEIVGVLSVLSAPLLIAGGVLLWQLGKIIKKSGLVAQTDDDEESTSIFNRIMRTIGQVVRLSGLVGIGLVLVGYLPASNALIFPTIYSLGLIFLILVLILLETDLYDVITNRPPDSGTSLIPSLVALSLVVLSLPAFALIWGMSYAELMEFWVLFRDGFSFGETRIRPGDFLVFLLIFAVGYALTKMMQNVISTSVLKKTKIHHGSQKAMISGLGYIGVFASGIAAFAVAGIDFSSLAIVLGALSVGIGFGLQNIVSNFVSGIILLIERPVTEGDWIEVNGVMGTVRGVSVRSTTIETFDRTDVIVPNADLVSGAVTNWTRFNKSGRLILKVDAAFGTDTRRCVEILEKIGRNQDGVSFYPIPPQGLFRGFGDGALKFELRLILTDVETIMQVETEVYHQIAEVFAQEGIEIPYLRRDLVIKNLEDLSSVPPDIIP